MERITRHSYFFFFSSRRRHTRLTCDWSSDVCSSDLEGPGMVHVVVKPAAFLPPKRGRHHEIGHETDIPQLDQVAVEPVAPVVTLDLIAQQADHGGRPLQALIAPDDAHIVP